MLSGCALHFRRESGLAQRQTLLDEGTQGLVGLRPAQETEDAEQKDVSKTIPFRLFPAGVGHARQHLDERVIHRCKLSMAASWYGMVTPGDPVFLPPWPMRRSDSSSFQQRESCIE
jgi:hypothetical protein